MTLKNVTIGDTYQERGKAKAICTVIDFHTVTNMVGEIVRHECIATKELLGQTLTFEVPFSTVVRNRT